MRVREGLSERNIVLWWTIGFALISLLGVLDYAAGVEFRFAFFYLIPVTLVAWFTGSKAGLVASVLSILAWMTANLFMGEGFSHPAIALGNMATIFGFYLVVSLLSAKLKEVLRRESTWARSDYLTGALNARAFYETIQREIDFARRYQHPLTIAYFDIDNFKAVNDRAGHHAGDDLLRLVVKTIKESIRTTDIVARLGGDEFAVLFPQSKDESIVEAIRRIQEKLLVSEDPRIGPITFSIGALTCLSPPPTVDEVIRHVDQLMYSVKRDGKNRLRHEIMNEASPRSEQQNHPAIAGRAATTSPIIRGYSHSDPHRAASDERTR